MKYLVDIDINKDEVLSIEEYRTGERKVVEKLKPFIDEFNKIGPDLEKMTTNIQEITENLKTTGDEAKKNLDAVRDGLKRLEESNVPKFTTDSLRLKQEQEIPVESVD